MKSSQFLKEGFVEDANEVHADHEVQMARSDLFHAAEDALILHKLLRNVSEQQGLEGWVAAKITLAADYLNTVREYVEYQLMSGTPGQITSGELAIAESDQQGNFAGDTRVDVGGAAMKKIKVGDTVKYFGEKAEVVEVNPSKNYARISAKGKTLNVRLSDLKQSGQGMAEVALKEFAPGTGGDNDGDGDLEEILFKYAKMWHNSSYDRQDQIEEILARMGWEIGEIETEEGGAFVVQPGDEHGKTYMGWSQAELEGVAEGSTCNHTMEGKSCPMHGLKECPGYKSSIEETTAGSVAGVVNPTPKIKAKVGSLFGGTYKQKKTKA